MKHQQQHEAPTTRSSSRTSERNSGGKKGKTPRIKEEWEQNVFQTNLEGHKRRRARKKPRVDYGKACCICKRDHKACNGQRPCTRCIEANIKDQCKDGPRRKFGRPKRTTAAAWDTDSSPSSSTTSSPPQHHQEPIPMPPKRAASHNLFYNFSAATNNTPNTSTTTTTTSATTLRSSTSSCCGASGSTLQHHSNSDSAIASSKNNRVTQEEDVDYLSCVRVLGGSSHHCGGATAEVKVEHCTSTTQVLDPLSFFNDSQFDSSPFISSTSNVNGHEEAPMLPDIHYFNLRHSGGAIPTSSAQPPLLECKEERPLKRKHHNLYTTVANGSTTTAPLPHMSADFPPEVHYGLLGEVMWEIERMTHSATCEGMTLSHTHHHHMLQDSQDFSSTQASFYVGGRTSQPACLPAIGSPPTALQLPPILPAVTKIEHYFN